MNHANGAGVWYWPFVFKTYIQGVKTEAKGHPRSGGNLAYCPRSQRLPEQNILPARWSAFNVRWMGARQGGLSRLL